MGKAITFYASDKVLKILDGCNTDNTSAVIAGLMNQAVEINAFYAGKLKKKFSDEELQSLEYLVQGEGYGIANYRIGNLYNTAVREVDESLLKKLERLGVAEEYALIDLLNYRIDKRLTPCSKTKEDESKLYAKIKIVNEEMEKVLKEIKRTGEDTQ